MSLYLLCECLGLRKCVTVSAIPFCLSDIHYRPHRWQKVPALQHGVGGLHQAAFQCNISIQVGYLPPPECSNLFTTCVFYFTLQICWRGWLKPFKIILYLSRRAGRSYGVLWSALWNAESCRFLIFSPGHIKHICLNLTCRVDPARLCILSNCHWRSVCVLAFGAHDWAQLEADCGRPVLTPSSGY